MGELFYTMLVGRFNKELECIRPPVNTLNGKGMRRVVTPRKVAWKLRDRHHFHGIDTQLLKIGQFFHGTSERTRLPFNFYVKGADMHLINDKLIPRGHAKVIITPVECFRIIYNSIADRAGHLSGIRINAGEGAFWTVDQVSVFIPCFLCTLYRCLYVR